MAQFSTDLGRDLQHERDAIKRALDEMAQRSDRFLGKHVSLLHARLLLNSSRFESAFASEVGPAGPYLHACVSLKRTAARAQVLASTHEAVDEIVSDTSALVETRARAQRRGAKRLWQHVHQSNTPDPASHAVAPSSSSSDAGHPSTRPVSLALCTTANLRAYDARCASSSPSTCARRWQHTTARPRPRVSRARHRPRFILRQRSRSVVGNWARERYAECESVPHNRAGRRSFCRRARRRRDDRRDGHHRRLKPRSSRGAVLSRRSCHVHSDSLNSLRSSQYFHSEHRDKRRASAPV